MHDLCPTPDAVPTRRPDITDVRHWPLSYCDSDMCSKHHDIYVNSETIKLTAATERAQEFAQRLIFHRGAGAAPRRLAVITRWRKDNFGNFL